MPFLIIILFIVISVISSAGKAKEKARREQAKRQQQGQPYAPPPRAGTVLPNSAFDWAEEPAASPYAAPASGSLAYDSSEGDASSEGAKVSGAFAEGSGTGGSLPSGPSIPHDRPRASITHTVRPFTESDHSHVESSMTGNIPCPPTRPVAGRKAPMPSPSHAAPLATAPYGLSLDRSGVRQGILYAEILGKPRALQARGRR
ncbi:MAG: hypothetical protein VB049_00635 [Candidatus Pelethousia sp.]|nr:hypothetical protein [Candidatus Pelethousia sp.]